MRDSQILKRTRAREDGIENRDVRKVAHAFLCGPMSYSVQVGRRPHFHVLRQDFDGENEDG